jgi:uncharacterized membrane protein
MFLLDLLMRILHIFGATILVGAMVFMLAAFLPAARNLEEEPRKELFALVRKRWAMLIGIGTALLFVSGLYNAAMISIGFQFPEVNYNALLAVKLVLAIIVFLLAALVSGRSGAAQKMQQQLGMWLLVTLLLLVATLTVAAYMKTVVREPKVRQAADSSQSAPLHPARG